MNRTLESRLVRWEMDLERRASEVVERAAPAEAARAQRFVDHVRSQRGEPKEWKTANYWHIALSLALVVLLLISLWTEH